MNLLKTSHLVVNGDSRIMNDVSDESIDLIITSPPYWQLKDYGSKEQIGFNDSYEEYINNLNLVWSECYRILQKGCRLCINIGDQFARSVYYGRYKVIPIHSEIIRFCETIGLDFMGKIIWQKTTTSNTTGGASIMGSFPYPRNGIVKLDFEYILLFKKPGESHAKITKEQKESAKLTIKEWNTFFTGHWTFPGARQDKHLAMFPDELPYRLIRMFSFPGETVLDPFGGSGTTSKVAKELNRNSICYEINSDFIQIIEKKIGGAGLFGDVHFNKQESITSEMIVTRLKQLPYQFIDVININKKVDVKKLQYGSKIDASSQTTRVSLFKVQKVLSPEMLLLNNNLRIRLIGIKSDDQLIESAENFLWEKLSGKRVYLKHDRIKYDQDNNLLVYLYLENKTFINMHLLKEKYVHVDNNLDFLLKEKFNNIRYGGHNG